MPPKTSLLEILKATDLDELATEIAAKEAELEHAIKAAENEIDALQAAHKLASIAQNGKPPKKTRASPQRRTEPGAVDRLAQQIAHPPAGGGAPSKSPIADRAYAFLMKAGSATASKIAREIGLTNATSIYAPMQKDPRFKTDGTGVWMLAGE